MILGEALVKSGVVTPEELARAMHLQARVGGKLGPILVQIGAASQAEIDRVWVASHVTPAVEQAIDRACGNQFTRCGRRSMRYVRVRRRDTIIEDMMAAAAICAAERVIEGECAVRIDEMESLPIRFSIDMGNGFCLLEDEAEQMLRRWVPIALRRAA